MINHVTLLVAQMTALKIRRVQEGQLLSLAVKERSVSFNGKSIVNLG